MWPVILITAGVLFLLDNLKVLNVDWTQLWRLWPVLLVLVGLEILLGRRSLLGSLIVVILTMVIVGGLVLLLVASPSLLGAPEPAGVQRISEPLDGVEKADLQINFAAGQLDVRPLVESLSLIEGELNLATEHKPAWAIERSDHRASMTLRYPSGIRLGTWVRTDRWDLRLSPKAGLDLNVDVGAGGATIDLTGLDIRSLEVKSGVGQSTVTFPAQGRFAADLNGGVGATVLEIPAGMAARLVVDRGIGTVNVSERYRKDGNTYVTDDWETNSNRLDVKVEVGVGMMTVKEP